MNFEDIKSHDDLQKVSTEVVWQNFERLTAFIFEKNNFLVETGRVKTFNKMKRQYDVIAKIRGKTFLVECKKWSSNHYRLSALRSAVRKHKERAEFYKRLTSEYTIPIIVTLIEEDIQLCEDVPIIPIFRLNSFINEEDIGLSSPQVADDDAFSAMQVKPGASVKQDRGPRPHDEFLLAGTK
jgi:hypothetical protein